MFSYIPNVSQPNGSDYWSIISRIEAAIYKRQVDETRFTWLLFKVLDIFWINMPSS